MREEYLDEDGMQSQFGVGYPDEGGARCFVLQDCDWQCLNCPLPPGQDCLWDDPSIGEFDLVEYPEFFWWRFNRIFGDSDEFLEITPDMMDEYFKEPNDPLQTRCPRCLSTEVTRGYPQMECKNCGYNEPLIDFPISYDFYRFLCQCHGWEDPGPLIEKEE